MLSNLASAVAPEEAAWLRAGGIPVLEGTSSGLVALRMMLRMRDAGLRPAVVRAARRPPIRSARAGAAGSRTATAFTEAEGLQLLGDYGVPVIASRVAATRTRPSPRPTPSATRWC